MVSVSLRETEEGVASLIDSKEEEFVLAVDQDAHPTSKTRSDKYYLIKYDEAVTSLPKPTKKTTHEATRGETERALLHLSSSKR